MKLSGYSVAKETMTATITTGLALTATVAYNLGHKLQGSHCYIDYIALHFLVTFSGCKFKYFFFVWVPLCYIHQRHEPILVSCKTLTKSSTYVKFVVKFVGNTNLTIL